MRHVVLFTFFIAISTAASATVPVGTIALYSDGRVEKLIATEEEGLRWEDDRMRQFLRSRNPVMPVLESRQLVTGNVYFQELERGDPEQIKQLPLGTPVHFSVIRHRDGERKRRFWKCEFLGSVREEVLGEPRDLERYQCKQSSFTRKLWLRIRDTREFTFSPELGVIVSMERKTAKGKTRARQLVAMFEPGEADYKTLSRAVRKIREK